MKTLYNKIRECDGAATPASTMGMGNPCAPGPDGSVGSGDMFPTEHTAKAKKEKKKKKAFTNKSLPNNLQEGLLDDDFGMTDDFDDNLLASYIDQYGDFYKFKSSPSKEDYYQFFESFQCACRAAAGRLASNDSLMKAFRSKEVTIVIFKEETPLSTGRGIKKGFKKGIEIRRFIKNPLPQAIEIAWDDSNNDVRGTFHHRVNHPQMINIKNWVCCICPGDLYDKINNACFK